MAEKTFRYIILTGAPGSGKTTVVKKVCNILKEKSVTLDGFFTEEVRSGRERTGFDVILMNGVHKPLASLKSNLSWENLGKIFVGKYVVDVKSFESCVLPLLSSYDKNSVLVLDEIGKMETLSQKFSVMVMNIISNNKCVILATIPLKTATPIFIVEKIKSHPKSILLTVNRENRDMLVDKVTNFIIEAKEKNSVASG